MDIRSLKLMKISIRCLDILHWMIPLFHHFGYIVFENTYQTTSFTAAQHFAQGTGTTLPENVSVQLQQSTDGGKTYTDYGTAQTLNADGNWTYCWKALPSVTADNEKILYQAVEAAVSKYTISYGSVTGNIDSGYQQTITDTYAKTNFTIHMAWNHGTQSNTYLWPRHPRSSVFWQMEI